MKKPLQSVPTPVKVPVTATPSGKSWWWQVLSKNMRQRRARK